MYTGAPFTPESDEVNQAKGSTKVGNQVFNIPFEFNMSEP